MNFEPAIRFVNDALDDGHIVCVQFDPRVDVTGLPERFRGVDALRIDLSYHLLVPPTLGRAGTDGLRFDVSFDRQVREVFIPWRAVSALLVDAYGLGMLCWGNKDLHGAKEPTSSTRPALRAIKGGAS